MTEVVLAGACRTAIGKFGGSLAGVPAVELGAIVIREALARAGVRAPDVDEVLMGCVLTAGLGQNPARQAAMSAGVPAEVPAMTLNNVCGSGLKAQAAGVFADEIVPVVIPQKKGDPLVIDTDEHPRPATTIEQLAKLRGVNGPDLTVTAGNASGVNDGAAALAVLSAEAAKAQGLTPKARIVAMAAAGVEPRIMGVGPAPAVRKVLARAGMTLDQMDVIELNEAFAAQALAVLRDLGLPDDAPHVNANGGAIALGHPLGMSGARLIATAMYQLHRTGGRYALCTMCIGVGQGIAIIIERV